MKLIMHIKLWDDFFNDSSNFNHACAMTFLMTHPNLIMHINLCHDFPNEPLLIYNTSPPNLMLHILTP
jgi:hypothetical protein